VNHPRQHARFPLEAAITGGPGADRIEHLERDAATQQAVARDKHGPHPAPRQEALDDILPADNGAGRQHGRGLGCVRWHRGSGC